MTPPERAWDVLLLGGASGVGKTRLSRPLARRYGINLVEVDDLQVALERVTTPATHPLLHFWRANWADYSGWPPEAQLQHVLRVARKVFAPALEAVIAQHLEAGTPMLLEGDFLLPELATLAAYEGERRGGRVRPLFVYEPDEAQIAANYREREGNAQPQRARVSWLYSEWLRAECARWEVPTLPVRPWTTGLERACAVLTPPSPGAAAPHPLA